MLFGSSKEGGEGKEARDYGPTFLHNNTPLNIIFHITIQFTIFWNKSRK